LICLNAASYAGEDDELTGKPVPKKRIALLLWRGMTEGEKGFVDYFRKRDLPVEILPVLDCAKDRKKLPGFIAQLKTEKPDLIYAFGTTVMQELAGTLDARDEKKNILDIPIVFCFVAYPRSPSANIMPVDVLCSGRNFTGVSHVVPMSSQLSLIRKMMTLQKIAVIYNPKEGNSLTAVEELAQHAADQTGGFELIRKPVPLDGKNLPDASAIPALVEDVARVSPDLVYIPSDSFLISNSKTVAEEINKRGLKSFSATEESIRESGALMGLVSRYYNVGQFAAFKAEKILFAQAKPGEIPVETLKSFVFLLNMETARKLDFYPPLSVLEFAEVVKPLR
jgi:putative ABC transport system substrate-binding protein